MAPEDFGGGGDKILVPLELKRRAILPTTKSVGREAQARPQFRVVARRQERFEREAAEDAGELLRPADARRQILSRHGVGHADEVSGDFGGAPFGGAKKQVGDRPLKGAERRAVNRVNNDGNPRAPRRQAGQEAGFAAVSMDDARRRGAKHFDQTQPGQKIAPRMNGTNQRRQDGQQFRLAAKADSSEPSGPVVGPATRLTSRPG
jgi:hypothetical protein